MLELTRTTRLAWSWDPFGRPAHAVRGEDYGREDALTLCGQVARSTPRGKGQLGEREGLCALCCEPVDRIAASD